MTIISKLKLIFLFSIIYFLFSASAILAAEFSFNPQFIQARPGDEFSVKLLLNTQGQKINAVEGKIVFPAGKLEVKEISDGNSIINLWAQKPALNDGNITFAGVIPGGYNSQEGLVLSISFKSKEEGGGLLHLEELKSLLNDGLGTASSITSKDFQFLISRTASSPAISTDTPDQERPESFVVYLSKDKNIFDEKWFVVFATQDKKSGINRYEVAEDKKNVGVEYDKLNWHRVESPYVLNNQNLADFVYVKAIDNEANERVSVLLPAPIKKDYKTYLFWSIIALIVFGLLYNRGICRRKKIIN